MKLQYLGENKISYDFEELLDFQFESEIPDNKFVENLKCKK